MAWLLTWFVQSMALGAVTAVLVRLPGFRTRASARAVVWSIALGGTAVLAVAPLLTWPAAEAVGPAAAAVPAGPADAPRPLVLPAIPGTWMTAGLAFWVMGAAAWMAWTVREVVRVVRLKRACEPWSADDRRRLASWVGPLLGERGARLQWCDCLDGPALLGFGSPVIAVPRLHGARLSDDALQHVLLHEAAHLRRRDDWAALAELGVAGLLWINPVVHMARRGLGLAREMACDDWVIRQTSAPAAYARCLTAVADLQRVPRRSPLAAAATSTRSILARRVTRVLDAEPRPGTRAAQLFALLTPVAVGLLAIALIQAPPLVVDGPVDADSLRVTAQSSPVAAPADAPLSQGVRGTTPNAPAVPRPQSTAVLPPAVGKMTTADVEADPIPVSPGETRSSGNADAAEPSLRASPVPGAGVPGVPVAAVAAATDPVVLSDNTPWWGRAAGVGSVTSEGATAAGQKTASFFKRLGSSVSRTLTR